MRFRHVVALVMIGTLEFGLSAQPASAGDRFGGFGWWRKGAIDHAQKMRRFRDFDIRSFLPPTVLPTFEYDRNPDGVIGTYQPKGATVTYGHAFFKDLGTNGRTCFTCHRPQDGWSLSAASAKARFESSRGYDPLFRLVDGATCPTARVTTTADKRKAYKLLTEKGLIRVGLPLPAAPNAQFEMTAIDDPYGCTFPADPGSDDPMIVSVYRRPLPSTNLGFLATIMWDGREPSLEQQAIDATLGHAQAKGAPNARQLAQIVDFESGLFTAQAFDHDAHRLTDKGAKGGPYHLSRELASFEIGMNNPFGPDRSAFDPAVFDLYTTWAKLSGGDAETRHRLSVERGERVFNGGFCVFCHNTPNVGNQSFDGFHNIGIADADSLPALDTADLPVFTLTCKSGSLAEQVYKVTDPGRALITGQCADIGFFKVPSLRGLAARAPYFHNGSAATLTDVVDFYVQRFALPLTEEQKDDLVNFLKTL